MGATIVQSRAHNDRTFRAWAMAAPGGGNARSLLCARALVLSVQRGSFVGVVSVRPLDNCGQGLNLTEKWPPIPEVPRS